MNISLVWHFVWFVDLSIKKAPFQVEPLSRFCKGLSDRPWSWNFVSLTPWLRYCKR